MNLLATLGKALSVVAVLPISFFLLSGYSFERSANPELLNYSLLLVMIVLSLFVVLRLVLGRKKERLYILKQKEAIEKERNRIAADIHDDIGAELTNIAILSRVLKETPQSNREESIKLVNKIEFSSNEVILKMDEVIWALNSRNYTLKHLVARIRNYVSSLCDTKPDSITLLISNTTQVNYSLTAEFAGNVFLVVKELLQNAVKHSKAPAITLNISIIDSFIFRIHYEDNGIGFDTRYKPTGNGLYNIRRRVSESKGAIDLFSETNKGCVVKIIFPLETNKL